MRNGDFLSPDFLYKYGINNNARPPPASIPADRARQHQVKMTTRLRRCGKRAKAIAKDSPYEILLPDRANDNTNSASACKPSPA